MKHLKNLGVSKLSWLISQYSTRSIRSLYDG